MTWLVVEKVVPPLLGGTPPDYGPALSRENAEPDCWLISWNDRVIGFSASQVTPYAGGAGEVRSVVALEDVPLDSLLSEMLGVWSQALRPLLGTTADFRLNATVATRIRFDELRELAGFTSVLQLEGSPAVLTVDGHVTAERKLAVVARMDANGANGGTPGDEPLLRQELELPPNALVSDAFTPRSELRKLHVGQSWTIPVYRPFPPNSPMEIVAVRVERHEIIIWEGSDVETLLVVYHTDAGSGIRASREPVGREWVSGDGTVLRQEIGMSGLRLQFERLPPESLDMRKSLLDPARHPRVWGLAEAPHSGGGR